MQFQSELAETHPNISVIDITRILDQIGTVTETLLASLQILAWFSIAVGLLVLGGTLSVGHRDRRDQTALLRTLGLSRRRIAALDGVEFLGIGILAWAFSAAVSIVLGWALAQQLDVPFSPDWGHTLKIVSLALPLPLLVGLAVNWKTYSLGVMDNLRRES